MKDVRVLEIKQSVFEDNDKQAKQLRVELKKKGVFLLNLMSSPGERVIIVMGAVCVIKSRVLGTLTKYISCIA